MSHDFIPQWLMILLSLECLLLTFFRPPHILSYLHLPSIYILLKEIGFRVIPETTVPVLAIFIMTQLIQDRNKNKDKDSNHLYFLWFGIFALFSTDLYYLSYTVIAFICFYLNQSIKNNFDLISILKTLNAHKFSLFFVFILTAGLFFFFPRFPNFLPGANNKTLGKIGYSKEINNSTIKSLTLSGARAFFAGIRSPIPQEALYWRGRIHATTDGYNWRSTRAPNRLDIPKLKKQKGDIEIQMKFEQNFGGDLIILDSPIGLLEKNFRSSHNQGSNEVKYFANNKKFRIKTLSRLDPKYLPTRVLTEQEIKYYTQLPGFIPNILKEFDLRDKNRVPETIIQKVSSYLLKQKFIYTLEPGRLTTMTDFLKKKAGYCTHFASLLGVILRINKIPTRLVSGFQGGQYNAIGSYIDVNSNDAHAWVEYFSKGRWNRVDPTSFISLARITLGGQQYFDDPNSTLQKRDLNRSSFFNRTKQYLDNLNYKVSLFLDDYNKEAQKGLSKKIQINSDFFFLLGVFLISLICMIYFFYLKFRTRKKLTTNIYDKYLKKLEKKLNFKNSTLSTLKTFAQREDLINEHEKLNQSQKDKAILILEEYKKLKFSNYNDEKKIKAYLNNLFI